VTGGNCDRHPRDDFDDVTMVCDSDDHITRCRHTRTRTILLWDLRVCFLILRGMFFGLLSTMFFGQRQKSSHEPYKNGKYIFGVCVFLLNM
jgi:hypothetical protein